MASQLQRLLQGLYLALSRDPQPQPGIIVELVPIGTSLPSSYWVRIEDDRLRGTPQVVQAPAGPIDPLGPDAPAHQSLDIDLYATGTLQQLVTQIGALPGFSARLAAGANGGQKASALVEGVFDLVTLQGQLSVYGSLLWALLKPVAWAMKSAYTDATATLAATNPGTAQAQWLSNLGDLYGLDRFVDEADEQYRTRLLYQVIKPRCNNVAMEEYLKWSLGLSAVTITDDPVIDFRFLVNLFLEPGGGLPVPIPHLRAVVEQIKAWGVIWAVNLTGLDSESFLVTQIVTESVQLSLQGAAETFDVRTSGEQYTAQVTQRYTDTARATQHYLWTNRWLQSHTAVISSTNNVDVVLFSKAGSYRSWVRGIIDVWRSLPHNSPATETWSVIAHALESAAYRLGSIEDGSLLRTLARETIHTALAAPYRETPPSRWRIFRTNRPTSRTNDTNNRLSAGAPSGTLVHGAGDPSWIHITRQ